MVTPVQLTPEQAGQLQEALAKTRNGPTEVRDEVIKMILQATCTDEELHAIARMHAGINAAVEKRRTGLGMPWQHGGSSLI